MTMIRKTRPQTSVMGVTRAFDRIFDDAFFRPMAWGGNVEARLPLDVTSSEDAVVIEAALPGIHPEDVEITIHQDNLTIGVKSRLSARPGKVSASTASCVAAAAAVPSRSPAVWTPITPPPPSTTACCG